MVKMIMTHLADFVDWSIYHPERILVIIAVITVMAALFIKSSARD